MNRYLSIPLVLTLFAFSTVWYSQHSNGERLTTSIERSYERQTPSRELLPAKEAEAIILQDWPTLSPQEVFSRRLPTQSYFAEVTQEPQRRPTTDFLWSLVVTVNLEMTRYPIHVNRESGVANVFADDRWQPYESWRKRVQSENEGLLTSTSKTSQSLVQERLKLKG